MAMGSFNSASETPDELGRQLLEEAGQKKPDLLKMKSLIDAGARLDITDDKRHTPLLVAASKRNADAAALLIDNGADKYAKANDGAAAIFYAVAHRDLKMVSMLLDKGVDPERDTFKGGLTALMWAANLKQQEIAEEIARRGGDVNRKNPLDGFTAPDYADDNRKPHIADSLRRIDARKKELALRQALEEKELIEQARAAAEKAALNAICDAGLPTAGSVQVMRRISFSRPSAKA